MYKYKCISRFNVLILVNGVIKEFRPQEIIESKRVLEHSKLRLINPKVKSVKKVTKEEKKKKIKFNADSET